MPKSEDFFDSIYKLTEVEQAAEHYAKFAEQYDAAMSDNGYITPNRCAATLRASGAALNAPVLDIGCGTGLSGVALRAAGFTVIDGLDFSKEMLEIARVREIYRSLSKRDLREPAYSKQYASVIAAGVLNPAHAPASTLDDILGVLSVGGVFVFSLNDHAIADGGYDARVQSAVDEARAELVSKDYGEHMPGQDLKAWVYALRKL